MKAKNIVADVQKAKLKEKKNLLSLTLPWKSFRSEELEALLEGLVTPQNLEVLNIDDYVGSKISSWMTNKIESWLPNLVHLTLSNINACDYLPPLWRLLALQPLELRHMSRVTYMDTESNISCSRLTPYPSLRELHFENIPDFKEWPTAVMVDNGGQRHEVFMLTSLKTLTTSGYLKLKLKPCMPTSIVDMWVCNSSEMLSLRWQMCPSLVSLSLLLRNSRLRTVAYHLMGGGLQYHTKLEDLLIESCDELINGPESMQTPNFTLITEESGLHQSGQTTGMVGRPYIIGNMRDLMLPKLTILLQGLERLIALKKLYR